MGNWLQLSQQEFDIYLDFARRMTWSMCVRKMICSQAGLQSGRPGCGSVTTGPVFFFFFFVAILQALFDMSDRLSNEMIREIIRYARVDELRSVPPQPPLTVVGSQVCRSWRHALLSDPTLWAEIIIPDMKLNVIKEMLHRSATAPLHVVIDNRVVIESMVSVHLSDSLPLLFEHIGRFKTLRIDLYPRRSAPVTKLVEQMLPYLSRPAPQLQNFHLHVDKGESFEHETFMQTLFSGQTPKLEHVYRRISVGVHEVLCSPSFRNLSSLHFNLKAIKTIQFDALLDVLELSPRLKTFEAETDPPHLDVVPPKSSDRRTDLSNLQKLTLQIPRSTKFLDLFVHHVTFPQIEVCQIKCRDLPYESWSSSSSFQSLVRQCSTQRLGLDFTEGQVEVLFSPGRSMKTGSSIGYDCNGVDEFKHVDDFFQLVYGWDLSYITEFCIGTGILLETSKLRTLFAFMPNLELLDIAHGGDGPPLIISVFKALLPLDATPETDTEWESNSSSTGQKCSKAAYIFPCVSLRELDISNIENMIDEEYASTLRTCSVSRGEHGRPFEKIIIRTSSCDLTDEADEILEPQEGFPIEVTGPYYLSKWE